MKRPDSLFSLPDEAATAAFATRLAHALQAQLPRTDGLSVALHGDLGAGKTTLVRYLLRALGVTGRIKSPSYAIAESYPLSQYTAWHFDFYRLSHAHEWEDAGFRDIFADNGLRLVEWPQQLPAQLIRYDLSLHLGILTANAPAARQLRLVAHNSAGLQLQETLCDYDPA